MTDMSGWSIERLHEDHAQALRMAVEHYDSATQHQRIRVFENPTFGRVMTLDDVVQVTERDNFIYHEMLTHVPILAHGAARHVLIVGGGDGGMAREVLKHRGVERVTMVEIDAGVVEFSKEYLPTISAGAFDVFMCGDAEPMRAVDVLKRAFAAETVHVRELRRGEGLVTDTQAA